ncbi:MAG: DUF2922 family protein [Firmicutes bacterium]|nr:DUF2922 family protein [Bacillota bacterium]
MNKNYYEFIFMGDQGKNIILRITNAKTVMDANKFVADMNAIINMDIIETSKGKPIARKLVKYIKPQVINIEVTTS